MDKRDMNDKEVLAAQAVRKNAKNVLKYLPNNLVDRLAQSEQDLAVARSKVQQLQYQQGQLFKELGQI